MPLSFLGGVFYSVTMLPERAQLIAYWNPFFYFIDGIRYAMIGIRESNGALGYAMIFGLAVVFGVLVHELFRRGWRLRR